MNFLMTLGLVMVLVGCALAGGSESSVSGHFHKLPPKHELEEDYYGDASYFAFSKRVGVAELHKRSAFEHTGEDGNSNVHQKDQETNGGYSRVAREAGTRGAIASAYGSKPSSHFGAVSSGLFGSLGNIRRDDKEETDVRDHY